jgi:hypothetical protein
MRVLFAGHDREQIRFLACTQRVPRAMTRPASTIVGIRVALPPLDRSRRYTEDLTGGVQSSAGLLGIH